VSGNPRELNIESMDGNVSVRGHPIDARKDRHRRRHFAARMDLGVTTVSGP
jgi:hypothetical protein